MRLAPAARLVAGLAVGLVACEARSPMTDWPAPTLGHRPPIVIAHRGASGERPEHTLAAYERAIDQGADCIEPDLVLTKDGVLVARHDIYLSTTTDVAEHPEFAARRRPATDAAHARLEDWFVSDFTLAELRTLRARQAFRGRSTAFDSQFDIPTFDEVLALAAHRSVSTLRRSRPRCTPHSVRTSEARSSPRSAHTASTAPRRRSSSSRSSPTSSGTWRGARSSR